MLLLDEATSGRFICLKVLVPCIMNRNESNLRSMMLFGIGPYVLVALDAGK